MNKQEAWGSYAQGWEIKVVRGHDGAKGQTRYEARHPFRQVVCEGGTPEEATACLVRTMCEESRGGSFNPHDPDARGLPPLQHVLEILRTELGNQLDLRRGAVLPERYEGDTPDSEVQYGNDAAKRSDVISGLATAIAALARVKAL